jgi:hypothetical protein
MEARMSDPYRMRPRLKPISPDRDDVGAWIAAILGVLFTLAVIFFPWRWSEPQRMASNTTTVEKTNPNEPPPKQPPL